MGARRERPVGVHLFTAPWGCICEEHTERNVRVCMMGCAVELPRTRGCLTWHSFAKEKLQCGDASNGELNQTVSGQHAHRTGLARTDRRACPIHLSHMDYVFSFFITLEPRVE